MKRYSEETIQKVLAATDIVELVGGYFPLKRAGKDYRANCPFHTEKTPSFYVIPNKQTYHCFGCGAGGTALRFVMEYENADFRTALKKLAERAGIVLPEEEAPSPEAERERRRRGRLLGLLGEAARFFHRQLLEAEDARPARDYLKSRGMTRQTAEDWQLGYAAEALKPLADWAKSKAYTARDLIDVGLVALKDEERPKAGVYARFRNRLMFPIHNDYGDVVAFSGRVLDAEAKTAKYLNSPETAVFQKGSTLFGLHRAKRAILKAGHAILCEGQIDLIALAGAGIENAVAPLGTACTREHARMLKRHTDAVVLCYDADAAGHKAADRAFAVLAPAGLTVKVASLPPGEDPDSMLRKDGVDAVRAMLAQAGAYMDVFFARRAGQYRDGDLNVRAEIARDAAAAVARFADPLVREDALRRTALRLSLETELFRREVRREIEREAQEDRAGAAEGAPAAAAPAPVLATLEMRTLDMVLQLALRDGAARAIVAGPVGDACRARADVATLHALLEANPDAADAAATNAYLATLPKEEEARLLAMIARPMPSDPEQTMRECLERLDGIMRRNERRQQIANNLGNPNAGIGEILEIQAKLQQEVRSRGVRQNRVGIGGTPKNPAKTPQEVLDQAPVRQHPADATNHSSPPAQAATGEDPF